MSDSKDFFEHVFTDPDEDPLLGEENAESGNSSDATGEESASAWQSEEVRSNGASHADVGSSACESPNQKQIVIDQQKDAGTGVEALNRALEQGWRLVRISLPNGEQRASAREAHRFVAVLHKEDPQSLFDFG